MADEDELTTAIGLFNYADSYWRSALALEKAKVGATHPDAPVCFLYYHAIELYLKAYLRAQRHSAKELRTKFGHNPSKLHIAAKGHGLHFDDEDVEVLTLMVETDAAIDARYLRTGYFKRPANKALHRTCKSLHQSVGEYLKGGGFPVHV